MVQLVDRLGEKYQVDELAAKYEFTGRTPLTVPKALEIKEELETIDRLLKQLEEAAKTAQIGIIDLEELSQFTEPGDVEQLDDWQRQIEEYLRANGRAARAGAGRQGYRLTPKAYRLFQGRLLERIFSDLKRRAPAATRDRWSAKGRSRCSRPRPMSLATRWPTWTFPAR